MEHVFLKWIDKETNEKIVVGALCKYKDLYHFKLEQKYPEIVEKYEDIEYVLPFDEVDKIYSNPKLFHFFQKRIIKPGEYTVAELKNQYGLDEYDEFKLLCKSEYNDNFVIEYGKEE